MFFNGMRLSDVDVEQLAGLFDRAENDITLYGWRRGGADADLE